MVVDAFLLTRDTRKSPSGEDIVLWCVDENAHPVRIVVTAQRSVFFVPTCNSSAARDCLASATLTCQWRNLELVDFKHQAVTGFYFSSSATLRAASRVLGDRQIEHWESDIRLEDRFLMERFLRGGVRIEGDGVNCDGYLDFHNPRLTPSSLEPRFRILSFDIECSLDGDLFCFALYGPGLELVLMIGAPQATSTPVRWFEDERSLLLGFIAALREVDPDIVIGWNVINFDFRLLVQRAKKQGISLDLGRDGGPVRWRDHPQDSNHGFVDIPGRVVIDGIAALKTATWRFDSFSLENVAQTLLGRGKQTDDVDHRVAQIEYDFHHDKPRLAAYNLEDARLAFDIFEHTSLISFLRLRSQLTGLELGRNGGSVAAFTNLYLPRLHRAGYVAPSRPANGGLASPGGYVMDSRPGLYEDVLVLDFKSLYPAIIRTFRVDPLGLVVGLKESGAIPGFRGARFSRTQHFLPGIIEKLWGERDEAKRAGDGPRSQAIKILMNSFYGVLGSGGCRFYDTRLASSITLRGHEIMKQTARWIEEEGHDVIYGDTDSTFVLLDKSCGGERASETGRKLAREITRKWTDLLTESLGLDSCLELEFETHFRRFLMPTIRGSESGSKKRYAGLASDQDGERIIVKGLETVRSDWTALAGEFQMALLDAVFHDKDPAPLVRAIVNQTRSGERDTDLIYRKQLRRPLKKYARNVPPHVRAARQAEEIRRKKGLPPRYHDGGTIHYVMTVHGPEPCEYASSPLDYDHYFDRQLAPVADGILPFVGLSFEGLVGRQRNLQL